VVTAPRTPTAVAVGPQAILKGAPVPSSKAAASSPASAPTSSSTASEDFNRVSEQELLLKKRVMEQKFVQNVLKPGDMGIAAVHVFLCACTRMLVRFYVSA
jgi:hypothetical protein